MMNSFIIMNRETYCLRGQVIVTKSNRILCTWGGYFFMFLMTCSIATVKNSTTIKVASSILTTTLPLYFNYLKIGGLIW